MSDYVNQMRGMSKDGKKLENQIERKSKRTVEQSPERIVRQLLENSQSFLKYSE